MELIDPKIVLQTLPDSGTKLRSDRREHACDKARENAHYEGAAQTSDARALKSLRSISCTAIARKRGCHSKQQRRTMNNSINQKQSLKVRSPPRVLLPVPQLLVITDTTGCLLHRFAQLPPTFCGRDWRLGFKVVLVIPSPFIVAESSPGGPGGFSHIPPAAESRGHLTNKRAAPTMLLGIAIPCLCNETQTAKDGAIRLGKLVPRRIRCSRHEVSNTLIP